MFSLICSEICKTAQEECVKTELSPEMCKKLLVLSSKHDVAHIIASALSKAGMLNNNDDVSVAFKKALMNAVYRDTQRDYLIRQLTQAFEKNEIPYIPLKGAVLRNYYPQTWLRTSCDVDIFVHEADLEKAVSVLINDYKYTNCGKGVKDVSLFSKEKNHVELHFNLVEKGKAKFAWSVLEKIWDASSKNENYEYRYDMTDEMFYFYHIAHMAKHFENGGCGVRPFIDLWTLNHNVSYDKEKRDKLLSDGDLLVFAKQAELLSEIWFGKAEHTDVTKQMENYILLGGVYGIGENRVAVQQQKKGGKVNYAFSKVFLPYDKIKHHYPILQKHRWLTPFMEIRRWCKLIFCGHLKRTTNELRYNNSLPEDVAKEVQVLLENIGL